MLTVMMDRELDSVLIEFESGEAGYAVELDDDRIVDYSRNPGTPIGVCLHNVSAGVKIDGLPRPDHVQTILEAIGVSTR